MRIHDQAADDISIETPDNWPDINVSGIQKDFSIDEKVAPEKLEELLTLAVDQVVKHFDPLLVELPLLGAYEIYFRQAVYQLAYSLLIPSLPVSSQHKSEPEEAMTLEKRMMFFERMSLQYQQKIPGFINRFSKPSISSELL